MSVFNFGYDSHMSLGWWDIIRRQKVDRLLMFLDRFDDHRRVQQIQTDMDSNGHLTSITMEMASGERYVRALDQRMINRLEVFECVTLYFSDPIFPDVPDLIENALVLLESLFVHDEHRFDCGVNGMHLNHRPLRYLSLREAVQFIRHVYDWHLDESHNTEWISLSVSPVEELGVPPTEHIPTYRYQEKKKDQDQEGYDAFIAEIDALLSEDDDATLPPEDQLPKAMPTG